jgi:Flp pilus assembly secretin CpaC
MKYKILAILLFVLLFAGELLAQPNATLSETENVLVHPSIAVAVNKAVVIRLAKRATKVAVSQPKIAEVEVVSAEMVVIHGKAIGVTSLLIWFEKP